MIDEVAMPRSFYDAEPREGPRVRISFPPATSPLRTSPGLELRRNAATPSPTPASPTTPQRCGEPRRRPRNSGGPWRAGSRRSSPGARPAVAASYRQRHQPRREAGLAGNQLLVEFLEALLEPEQRPGIS